MPAFFVLCSFLEIRANLDKLVDDMLPSIHKLILKNGMDPMRLVDISDNVLPILVCKKIIIQSLFLYLLNFTESKLMTIIIKIRVYLQILMTSRTY